MNRPALAVGSRNPLETVREYSPQPDLKRRNLRKGCGIHFVNGVEDVNKVACICIAISSLSITNSSSQSSESGSPLNNMSFEKEVPKNVSVRRGEYSLRWDFAPFDTLSIY